MTHAHWVLTGLLALLLSFSALGDIPPKFQEGPHPVQGLESFMARQGVKPYDLFLQEDGDYVLRRLIFQDQQFGAEVWMIDDSPTVEHAGTASIWPAWNVEASALYIEGTRPTADGPHRGWFCNADYSRLRPAVGDRPAVWAPEDPDIYYAPASPSDQVTRTNWRTGEQTVVAEWDPLSWPASGKRVYGLTRDGKHIFVDLPNRGIFVPFTRDEEHPIPRLSLYDGRPIGPGGESIGSNHFCVIHDHEEYGDLIALRTGMLIDRDTGARTNIVAPLCGNTNYLRAFYEGRIQYPEGTGWNDYGLPWFGEQVRLPTDLDMEGLHALWRNLPHATHGHESPSPDWQYIATDGGATQIAHVRSGKTEELRLSPDGTNYHLHWQHHPRFFVGWVRGWNFGRYERPEHGNILFQVFTDLTAQPVFDTNHRLNGYYSGGDFSMQSPDATKVHTASSMTGRFRNYVAVMARPRPPQALSWQAVNDAVKLAWQPASHSRETRGYLVYRSETSGSGYTLLTPDPVKNTTWTDTAVVEGTPYYYVVTALEHSGLESGYSAEAARAGISLPDSVDAPLVVYVEVEDALWGLDTVDRPGLAVGADRRYASDWYYVYRHPEADTSEISLEIMTPAPGAYHVWARLRSDNTAFIEWTLRLDDVVKAAGTDAAEWTWVRATETPVALADAVTLTFATTDAGAAMDAIVLATDVAFVPSGPRPETTSPPPAVEALRADNIRSRVNRLRWEAVDTPLLSHYQVYAARESLDTPAQQHLIGSPAEPEFIDWGLEAGTTYQYAVTTVDRRGNESAPVFAAAATPARETEHILLQLAFAEGQQEGAFEVSEGGGLRGPAYVAPQSPEHNTVAWDIDIPHDGVYYFWLRYLQRGSGRRGDLTHQAVEVSLNQEVITTLGDALTDLHVPDALVGTDHPLAPRLWTWAWPGTYNLEGVELPAGQHTLTLANLNEEIRYDVLIITNEPAFRPDDGRIW